MKKNNSFTNKKQILKSSDCQNKNKVIVNHVVFEKMFSNMLSKVLISETKTKLI